MVASVVYKGVPTSQGQGGSLFQGQKFWFSATVPQRQWYMENVKANGGEVVPLEKQADILLVDHTRKNPAPGTHSFKYVDLSIRNGKLENLDDHVVGGTSRADRPVGSVTTAPKGGRNHYTEAEDQFLWNWIKPLEEAGGATSGNSIYQQLEAINPRHTYQSWRDRWLKHVRYQKREITMQVHEEELHLQSTPRRQHAQPRAGREGEGLPVHSRASANLHEPVQAEYRPQQHAVGVIIPPREPSPEHSSALPALKSRGKAHSTRSAEYEKADYTSESQQSLVKVKLEDEEEEAQEKESGKGEDYLAEGQPAQERPTKEKGLAESRRTASPNSPTHGNDRNPSPSFQSTSATLSTLRPESPMPSFSTNQDDTPGPNEARKQSTCKGVNAQESTNSSTVKDANTQESTNSSTVKDANTQESTNSSTVKDANCIEETSQTSTQSPKRKRNIETDDEDEDNPSLPPFGNQERAKRSRKFKEEPRSLEIPSTPDVNVVTRLQGSVKQSGPSQELGSPTPRPRQFPLRRNVSHDFPSSPLLVRQDHTLSSMTWNDESDEDRSSPPIDREVYETSPSTPRQRKKVSQDPRTSPLSVHLVSDHDPPVGSSFSQTRSEIEQDNGSPTPEFETAPEFAQVWETAHEEAEVAGPDPRHSQDGTVAEMQPEEDFALPEPEGGWDDLALPSQADEEEGVADEGASQGEEDVAEEEESMESWVAAHLEADPDADDELLIRAAGIADLDFRLADVVYQHLARGKPVPENMKGVWTERDDMALRGNDAKEIRRIEEKHGKESLAGRWHWLENEQR